MDEKSEKSSIQGRPIAISAGQNRIAGNMIWYRDFSSVRPKRSAVRAIEYIASKRLLPPKDDR